DEGNDFGFAIFAGKSFTDNIFAEFRIASLGEAGLANSNPAIDAAFPDAGIEYLVPSLMGGYRWFPDQRFSPFVRAGLSFIQNDATGGPVDFEEQTGIQFALGGGVDVALTETFFLRGDLDLYDTDAWFAAISAGMKFGRRPTRRVIIAAPQAAPQPAPVVRAPAPPPPPEPTPQPEKVDPPAPKMAAAPEALPRSVDNDGDGVPNLRDACPQTAEGAEVDETGCAAQTSYEFPTVRFAYKSDALTRESEIRLRDAAAFLVQNPQLLVEVGGHTDPVGGQRYNQPLSERRAQQVADFMVRLGVSPTQIVVRGYGQLQPIATNNTEEGRAFNRRVELRSLNR
ncbi:MAG: OmpA family protein, partial [Pseudomonadota bacterium]